MAMVILALRCISKDHRHRNLQHSLRRPTANLAREQQSDGGFGNVYNTALAMQVSCMHNIDVWKISRTFLQNFERRGWRSLGVVGIHE